MCLLHDAVVGRFLIVENDDFCYGRESLFDAVNANFSILSPIRMNIIFLLTRPVGECWGICQCSYLLFLDSTVGTGFVFVLSSSKMKGNYARMGRLVFTGRRSAQGQHC